MKKYILILMLLPTAILAQYNGGTGDGYTSKIAIVEGPALSNTDFTVQVNNISVAPNPTASIINVTLDNSKNLEINARLYDIQGRVIREELFNNNNFEIDLSNQKTGVYILQLLSEGKLIATRKLLKL